MLNVEDVEACCSEVKVAICLMRLRPSTATQNYTVPGNALYNSVFSDRVEHLPNHRPTYPPKSSAVVFCCLYLLGWVCSHSSRRRMAGVREGVGAAGVHVGVGGLILFAFGTQTVQSMQIDKQ